MGKPRTPIGTFGEISFTTRAKGKVEARTRYRDWDGTLRIVQATDATRTAAERKLKQKLLERSLFQPSYTTITPDSTFSELADYWLEDLDLENRVSLSTRQLYARNMTNLVLPAFGDLTLREIGVARCDAFLKHLAKQSHSRAREARVALRLALGLAVRHEILPRNPMDHVSRLHPPPSEPNALTPAEVNAVRAAIRYWEQDPTPRGPKPDGQLSLIVEVILGTSARIGEVLAIRRCDIDVAGAPPTIRIAGTLVRHKGRPLMRQDHPKTARSRRVVALPSFTAEAVRKQLASMKNTEPEALLFAVRNGSPRSMNNVRRQLRHVMELTGIEGVTPHMLRRTVATAIDEQATIDLAAELLGHTDTKVTLQHYIRRNEMVNPITAELLDKVFAPDTATYADE